MLLAGPMTISVVKPWLRKLERASKDVADDDETLAGLRDTVVGGVHELRFNFVPSLVLVVDALDFAVNEIEAFFFSRIGQAADVLEEEGLWAALLNDTEVLRERIRSWVSKTPRVASRPVAVLREGLARRAPDEHFCFADVQLGAFEDLAGRHVFDGEGNYFPRVRLTFVGFQRFTASLVHLNGDSRKKARSVKTEVEPAGTGEE